jgi:hypothetical protein
MTAVGASCDCGAVRMEIDTAPTEVTECNCAICRRYGVLWAYYSPTQVRMTSTEGGTDTYVRGTRNVFHRCKTCGCVTHWSAIDPARDRMGLNARLLDTDVLAGATVRRYDGASV